MAAGFAILTFAHQDARQFMSASQPAPEALVACPVCGQGVAPAEYDHHLRREHDLVVYRGVRRPLAETLDAIRFDLTADPPSDVAWQALWRLARSEYPKPAKWLAGWLTESWGRLSAPRRATLFPQLVPLTAPGNDELIARLAASPDPVARHFALLALATMPAVGTRLVKPARWLLTDREADESAQSQVVLHALASASGGDLAARMVRWFTAGLGRGQAVRRLRALEARSGPHPVLAAALGRYRRQRPLTCPRCQRVLPRDEMEKHLWVDHRLLLEGLAVREPWEVVEGWADRYRAGRDPAWLERCRAAAFKLDPENGPARLERLLLARGAGDPAVQKAILARASDEHAGCCPWCYALVALPRETPPLEVNLRPGRLSAGGYEVETDERGVNTRLRVATPRGVVYDGPEPAQRRTPMGVVVLAAGPAIGLALAAALFWPGRPLPVVALLLFAAGLMGLFGWLLGRFERPAEVRAFDYAWSLLVPNLHAGGYDVDDSRFLAGLARLASRLERDDVPEGPLKAALHLTLEALEQRRAAPGHLAALCRLSAEVTAGRGDDPVALVERWAALAFEGRVPLAFAQHLFHDWRADFWTPGQLARLRLRVLDRAFEAGFEVQGLLDAGRNAPALGAVLGVDAPRRLAALRLLWSLRPSRPWDRLGDARTAFELAAVPGWIGLFERHPDLLLWQRDEGTRIGLEGQPPVPAVIQMTLAGIWVGDELFATPPRVFEVRRRLKGSDLRVGGVTFRSPDDVDGLTRVLERWFRYAFLEFLPQVDRVREWVSPSRAAILRAWGAVACPECGRHMLPRVGEVGVGLDEAR